MLRLRAYGGLTLERDGAPYTGPATQRRRLAVLAVLAASDTGVSRDRLTDYLWREADPARARHSLDEALSGLRRELRNDALFIGVATLRLNPEVLASDVADQAAALAVGDAERAAALYAGPFLDGFYVPGAGDFERWVESERSRRARAHARVLEGLAAAATASGDTAAALDWCRARVALDPLDTAATIGLLNALTTAGLTAEALRLVRLHETLVRSELDTVPGVGWAAAVDSIRAERARPQAKASGATASGPFSVASNATADTRAPARRHWQPARMLAVTALVVMLVVSALASYAMWMRRGAPPLRASPASRAGVGMGRASVAVIPFTNTVGDSADEHFSDGLTDELIGALSKVPGLKVTGLTSAFALKGHGLTVRTIADTLGVATVLEGSVRRAGERLKVTVQLVSATDNAVIWSESYDRNLKDVFAVQEEIARAVVGALAPTLRRRPPISAVQPRDFATYDLYLEGRYFLGRRTPSDLSRAAQYFEQAVARDPEYAQAYAGLADARVLSVVLADESPNEEVPRARAAAAAALRLDSTLAEAHAVLGNIREAFDWDTRGADTEFARAIALDPSYATAHLYWGINLLNRGRSDDAVAELVLARTLDPLSAPVRMQLGRAYVSVHRTEEAIAVLRSAIELNPQLAVAHIQLGEAYLQEGKDSEALEAFRRAAALNGARGSAFLAYALARTGKRDEAKSVLRALLSTSKRSYLPPVAIAKAQVALNDADAAFAWLERGYAQRAPQMRTIKVAPGFEPLHGDRRWLPLIRRIGLEP